MINRPVWAEIDLGAIGHNLAEIRRSLEPKTKIMAIVKANGYGHGSIQVARTVLAKGAERLGIAILQEGIELRKAGFGVPILILGHTPVEMAKDVVRYNLIQTVFDFDTAEAISWAAVQARKSAKIHLKVDTGMGRLGFPLHDKKNLDIILKIAQLPNLEIEGIYSHFAVSDIVDKEFSYLQLERFFDSVEKLKKKGLEIPVKHISNSGGILDLPQAHLNMVRAGISIYGLYPSEEVSRAKVKLKPAMSLKARIAQVKKVPKGVTISYGRTYETSTEETIATLPIGYADGYTRLLSNKAQVLVRGKKTPVIGRICMDQCMINITGIPNVEVGEEVVLFGSQGQEHISVEDLANLIGTINYEIVCMISARVPRLYMPEVL